MQFEYIFFLNLLIFLHDNGLWMKLCILDFHALRLRE